MVEILKEMGKVCENKKLLLLIQDFHRQRFNQLYKENPIEAKRHQKDYMWWSSRLREVENHLEQLHKRLVA
jgi:hypothetical protein